MQHDHARGCVRPADPTKPLQVLQEWGEEGPGSKLQNTTSPGLRYRKAVAISQSTRVPLDDAWMEVNGWQQGLARPPRELAIHEPWYPRDAKLYTRHITPVWRGGDGEKVSSHFPTSYSLLA